MAYKQWAVSRWCGVLYLLAAVAAVSGDVVVAQRNHTGKVAAVIPDDLALKLSREKSTWHWTPWQYTRTKVVQNVLVEQECVPGNSADSFPDGILSDEQLRQGGFLVYVFFGFYSFTLLAYVCNDYFIPCVELICEDLKLPTNVAAATFMAVATSCPEFFVNVISTFLTKSDMGIGTIVGSGLFNALAIAAIGGLSAIHPIKLESRPVTRDVLIYMFNISVLVAIVWDGQVEWYEATVLAILWVVYFVVMFNSERAFRGLDRLIARFIKDSDKTDIVVAENGKTADGIVNDGYDDVNPEIRINGIKQIEIAKANNENDEKVKLPKSLFRYPSEKSFGWQFWWVLVWPLKLMLTMTIPSPHTYRRWYPLSFFMCIVWIGGNSYFVSWSMTVIGTTFSIPDSIMGMTFLAFGGCLPEACSIFIMSRRGEGGIGVSNALGANSLAILFALGLPWFVRCMVLLSSGAEGVILINSSGIEIIIGSLLIAVATLWLVLRISNFTLRKIVGCVMAVCYITFITFAILVEMGIILSDGVPRCW